jgi:hypothetical protein
LLKSFDCWFHTIQTFIVLIIITEHFTSVQILLQQGLTPLPSWSADFESKEIITHAIIVSDGVVIEIVPHHRVHSFYFLGLAPCNTLKINILIYLYYFAANEHLPLLTFDKVRKDPRFFLPSLESTP